MADLDDFFAKKDRKKKTVKKFATPEELAKKIDETVAITKKADAKASVAPRKEAPEGAVAEDVAAVAQVCIWIFDANLFTSVMLISILSFFRNLFA